MPRFRPEGTSPGEPFQNARPRTMLPAEPRREGLRHKARSNLRRLARRSGTGRLKESPRRVQSPSGRDRIRIPTRRTGQIGRAASQSALESPEVGEAIWNRTAEGVAQACAITFREGPYSYPDSENWADRKGCVTKRARISGGWRGDLEQDG